MRINIKYFILPALCIACYFHLDAQISINSNQTSGWFFVDGKDDTVFGADSTSNDIDDFIITKDGKVGIGTANPTSKLTIKSDGNNTGLAILKDARIGKVLSVDPTGNAQWSPSNKHFITYLPFKANRSMSLNITNANRYVQVGFYTPDIDQIKDAYGSAYGAVGYSVIIPEDGLYRIVLNVYFNTVDKGKNLRGYIYKNGTQAPECGFVSVTDPGGDISGYSMAIVPLKKNDKLDIRIGSPTWGTTVKYWSGLGHTYAYVEAL